MQIRVITMRYSEGLQGFPEDALRTATFGREVLSSDHHFFMHGNVPHIAIVLSLADAAGEGSYQGGKRGMSYEERKAKAEAEEAKLPEGSRPAFRALKEWRNNLAKAKGWPSYNIARNAQLLEIVRKYPKTLAEMKEIEGCTEKFCTLYGKDIIAMLGEAGVKAAPAPEGGGDAAASEEQAASGEEEMPF